MLINYESKMKFSDGSEH